MAYLRVAAVQMVAHEDVAENLREAKRLVQQAAQEGAELVVLPEYFCLMGQRDSDKLAIQEAAGVGPIQTFLAQTARALGIWLVGGSLPLQGLGAQRVRNACLVFDPLGRQRARYDKIHLFSFHKGRESYNEGKVLEPGEHPVAFDVRARDGRVWRMGLSLCYDLRFAHLYQALAADVLLVPAAFTFTTGAAHWEVLLRARAIENQAYVVAAAQGGTHRNGRKTWGHSMVVDPWGRVLAVQEQGAGLVFAGLDAALLEQTRVQLPSLRHRVPLAPVIHAQEDPPALLAAGEHRPPHNEDQDQQSA